MSSNSNTDFIAIVFVVSSNCRGSQNQSKCNRRGTHALSTLALRLPTARTAAKEAATAPGVLASYGTVKMSKVLSWGPIYWGYIGDI